ncbi:Replication protein [Propionibacterium freudenreichii]|nr:Replication protein [Propionibacterium freudenreichii]
MRFDWYSASLRDPTCFGENRDPEHIPSVLAARLGGVGIDEESPRGGYRTARAVRNSDGAVVARVMEGASHGWPLVWASGSASVALSAAVRDLWPRHEVTRMDSAEDFEGTAAFERLARVGFDLATRRHLKVSQVGDWRPPGTRGDGGRTLNIGSRTSPAFVRIYEKGLEQRDLSRPDWIRVELEVKPKGRLARRSAASMAPLAAWGLSRWASELLEVVEGVSVPHVTMRTGARGDDERALRSLTHQYGGVLSRLLQRVGSEEELGRWLAARIV